jgi:hypothetical protein
MNHAELHNLLFLLCGTAGCGFALARGGAPERIAALIFIAAVALTAVAAPPSITRFHTPEVGIALVDLLVFVGFAVLTHLANREWPLWMSSMQGIALLCHLPILFGPDVLPEAYVMMQGLWSWLILVVLVYGTVRHRRALRVQGIDPSWKGSSVR